MVDDSLSRPRRALVEDSTVEPVAADDAPEDTPGPTSGGRRRASMHEAVAPGMDAADIPDVADAAGTSEVAELPDEHVMFMRPDGQSAAPDPLGSGGFAGDAPAGGAPVATAGADAPADDIPDASATVAAPTTNQSDAPAPPTSGTPPLSEPPRSGRNRLLTVWVAGVLAMALATFGIVYQVTRKDPPVAAPTTSTATPKPTASSPSGITTAHLITEAETQLVQDKAGWKIAATVPTVSPASPRIACLVTQPGQPNPVLSSQRTLSTATKTKLALLHQMDDYASAADAEKVFALRKANLGVCDDVPAWIFGAASITGLGDEATSVTIAYQDAVVRYHTVLIVRVGTVVNSFDAASEGAATPPLSLALAAAKVATRQCDVAEGTCTADLRVVAGVPMSSGQPGWLIASDIPRITAGEGLWTETDPAQISSAGTGCENLTLKAAPGVTQGLQRTYLLLQDSTAPQNFGIDTLLLTTGSTAAATGLMTKIAGNISDCADRMATATVSEALVINGTADNDLKVVGKQFLITQKVGSDTRIYRVAVTATGNKVSYLLVNGTKTFNFSKDAWKSLALRTGQRASQAR